MIWFFIIRIIVLISCIWAVFKTFSHILFCQKRVRIIHNILIYFRIIRFLRHILNLNFILTYLRLSLIFFLFIFVCTWITSSHYIYININNNIIESNFYRLLNAHIVQFKSYCIQICIDSLILWHQLPDLGQSLILSLLMTFNLISNSHLSILLLMQKLFSLVYLDLCASQLSLQFFSSSLCVEKPFLHNRDMFFKSTKVIG